MYSQYDRIARVYDTLFCDKDSLRENQQIAAMLSEVSGSVYDIGCGTGLLTELIGVSPNSYLGIDPSVEMLNVFEKKHPDYKYHLINSRVEDDKSDITKYDWVISLFGSISYVDRGFLCNLSQGSRNHFLMFYKKNYHPVTYEKTNVEFVHHKYSQIDLREMFPHSDITYFNNYVIVKSR